MAVLNFMHFILGLLRVFVKVRPWARVSQVLGASVLCASSAVCANGLYEQALDAIAMGDTVTTALLLEQLTLQQPNDAGAWLDMAMLYCGAGYTAQALALFDAIEARFAPPPGIVELMKLQRANGCRGGAAHGSAWSAMSWGAQLGRGYESNVNQGVRDLNVTLNGAAGPLHLQLTPDYAPRGDGFTALGLDASWPVGPFGAHTWLQWQGQLFDQQHSFDVGAWQLGVTQPWHSRGWRGQLQANANWLDLGGARYQQAAGVRASAGPVAGLPPGWQADVSVGWRDVHYKTVQDFDARWVDVRSAVGYTAAAWALQGSAGWQRDVALATRPGGDRQGWSAEVLARWALQWGGVAELGGTVQNWLDNSPYAVGLIDQQRVQRSRSLRAALVWPAGLQGQWVLEARQVRSIDNIALFGYDALSLQLGYQWRFGQREP
jgi:hypothetical protein